MKITKIEIIDTTVIPLMLDLLGIYIQEYWLIESLICQCHQCLYGVCVLL